MSHHPSHPHARVSRESGASVPDQHPLASASQPSQIAFLVEDLEESTRRWSEFARHDEWQILEMDGRRDLPI
ncbi:hypothetical protein GCM10023175_64390 [Pseudonocardia xishanensis]|uniref:Glyoxalase-like domain-containing protein n=1 Tax=Pseudonocardia xishanensis TaxID=630995 RepID=A0ABP8S1U3_9PSEU